MGLRSARCAALILTVAISAAFPGWSATTPDAEKSLVVGFARLSVSANARIAGAALSSSVPLLLADKVRRVPMRRVSVDELTAAAELERLKALFGAGADAAAARKRRDSLGFGTWQDDKLAADRLTAEREVVEKREKLEAAIARAVAVSSTARRRTVVLWKGHDEGRLISEVDNPAAICLENGLDLLVFGKIENVQGFARLSLEVYVASTAMRTATMQTYAFPDDPESAAGDLALAVARAVSGVDFSVVSVVSDVPGAVISITGTGEHYEVANGISYCYDPGTYRVDVTASGFDAATQDIAIAQAEAVDVNVKLSGERRSSFSVTSVPSPARLSVSSLYAGESPVVFSISGSRAVGTARADGFTTEFFVLDARGLAEGETKAVQVALMPKPTSDKSPFESAKDGFYDALGRFVIVLPVAVVSYGVWQMYSISEISLANDLEAGAISTERAMAALPKMETGYWTSQTIFWVSAGVSALLFVDVVINFVNYINSTP